jgi:hypothetical protein
VAVLSGCDASEPGGDAWLELGWGEPFQPFEDGDALALTIGSQGARMFPLAVRTGGLDPSGDKGASEGAMLDVLLSVETSAADSPFEVAVDAVPVDLREQADGTRLFYYVPLIVEETDAAALIERRADLDAEIVLGARSASFSTRVVLQGVSP